MDERRGPSSPLRTSIVAIGLPMAMIAWLIVGAWLTGRVLSDRWWLTQWLLWIPTPAALMAALLGLTASLRPGRRRGPSRRRLIVWSIVSLLLLVFFAFVEHRLLRPAPEARGAVKLAHWTISETMDRQVDPFVERVTTIDADLTVLTNAGGAPWDRRVRRWLGGNEQVQMMRPFAILSKFPILEQRWLAHKDDIALVLLVIDARAALGRELVVYLIDLPSDPRRARARIASTARELIAAANAPPPDIVLGDFNMTRGSDALHSIAPDMHLAYDEGGHGYAATYHRRFPLYHIDHMLLCDGLRCTRYDVPEATIGRHRPQVAWIVVDD